MTFNTAKQRLATFVDLGRVRNVIALLAAGSQTKDVGTTWPCL